MPEDKISSALRELSVSAKQLNELGDTVNQAFKSVETAIVKTGVGLPTTIDIGEYDGTSYKLGFSKMSGIWRVVIGEPNLDELDNPYTSYSPWENQPRDIKVFAVTHLPRLIAALHDLAKKRINDAHNTVAQLARSLPAPDGE